MRKKNNIDPGCDNGGHRPSFVGTCGVRECDTCAAYTIKTPDGVEVWIRQLFPSDPPPSGKFLKMLEPK